MIITYRHLLFTSMCVVGVIASTATRAQTQFDRLRVCGGGTAAILEMSPPIDVRPCMTDGSCYSSALYKYLVQCGDGRQFSGIDVYLGSSINQSTFRKVGNAIQMFLGNEKVHDGKKLQPFKGVCVTGSDGSPIAGYDCRPKSVDVFKEVPKWETFPAGYAPIPRESKVVPISKPPTALPTPTGNANASPTSPQVSAPATPALSASELAVVLCKKSTDLIIKIGNCTRIIEKASQHTVVELSDAYTNRGQARASLGDHKIALEEFDRAIKILPSNVRALVERGNLYKATGKEVLASEDYSRARKLNPLDQSIPK
jgi:hypothetical protein